MNSASAASAPGLIGVQRAAFDRADRLQQNVGRLRLGVVLTAITAALLTSAVASYATAAISTAITISIIWLEHDAAQMRSLAERVRRMTLIAEGLGVSPPVDEIMQVGVAAAAFADEARARDDPDYFASKAPPGLPRLGELLEESAFWTHQLLLKSARSTWIRALGFAVAASLALITVLPMLTPASLLATGRIVCAVALFIMSRDLLIGALAYERGAAAVGIVLHRLPLCRKEGWPQDHLLRIVGDYNSAVEAAPLPRPGAYQRWSSYIDALWKTHKATS